MLVLAGQKAPSTSSSALQRSKSFSVAETAGASGANGSANGVSRTPTRVSDRETEGQKNVLKKLKELQSKRAEMVKERKKVRNYSMIR